MSGVRVLQGEKGRRCAACKREVASAGRKHKNRARGEWCSGVANVQRELAMDLVMEVHDLYSQAFDLIWQTEDFAPAISFCRRILTAVHEGGIKTRGKLERQAGRS